MAAKDVLFMMKLRNVHVFQNGNHRAGVRKMKISANRNYFIAKTIKKMNTHTLCFCPLTRNLQAFENLKSAQGSQRRKQRISNHTHGKSYILYFPCEIQLSHVKYHFFQIYIMIDQYFPVFHLYM